jgi:curved DNA-binding protein CbpA
MQNFEVPKNRQEALKLLGLSEGASKEEMVKAYRRLSIANHPDKFPESTDQATRNMQAINVARDLLR